jgi:hypothetical protein
MHRDHWLALLSVAMVVVLSPVVGRIVLGPVNRAAGRLKAPTRFLLPDFMWLVLQLQFVLWYCVQFVGLEQRLYFPLLLVFLMGASILMWGGAVSFLSRAGVRSNLRRGIFIMVLLPATLALMVIAPVLPVLSYLMQTDTVAVAQILRLKSEPPPNAGLVLLIAGLLAIPLAGWGLRRMSRWMVAELDPSAAFVNAPVSSRA